MCISALRYAPSELTHPGLTGSSIPSNEKSFDLGLRSADGVVLTTTEAEIAYLASETQQIKHDLELRKNYPFKSLI